MNKPSELRKKKLTPLARRALQVALFFLPLELFLLGFLIYQITLNPATHLYVIGAISVVALLSNIIGIGIIRNRPETGLWISGIGWLVLLSSFCFLFSGLGFHVFLFTVLTSILMVSRTLQGRQATVFIALGFISGILSLLVDQFMPAERRVLDSSLRIVSIIVAVMALLFIVFVIRQFRDYSIRTKLLIAFLSIALITIVVVGYTSVTLTTNEVNDRVGQGLASLAASTGSQVAFTLEDDLDTLRTLSLNDPVQTTVMEGNVRGTSDIQTMLALDIQWATAPNDDPLVVEVTKHRLVLELQDFQNAFPSFVEVFVTNKFGAVVASTARTSDYYQADEVWWQAAYKDGTGNIFVGEPDWDPSILKLGSIIAVPIYSHTSDEVIGVLRATVDISRYANLVEAVLLGQTGQADLVFGNILMYSSEAGIYSMSSEDSTALNAVTGEYGMAYYRGRPALVSIKPVSSPYSEYQNLLNQLGWRIIIHQSLTETQQAASTIARFIILAAIGLGIFVIALAFIAASAFVGPITRLATVADQVAAGDLRRRAKVESKDEIGSLAGTFNSMTAQLNDMVEGLEQRVEERTKALATSADVSRRLSTILDPSQLVKEVVEQLQSAFNYYHVHIYLLDEVTREMVMAGGTGEAGQTMLARGHRLASGQGLVGRAASTAAPVLVTDVTQAEGWVANPLLPETRSELAVPLTFGGDVIGVLDVQQNRADGLNQTDADMLQAIGSQVAIGLQNARTFVRAQERADREALLTSISQRIQRTNTAEEALKVAVRELGRALNVPKVSVKLGSHEEQE
ncbi:MAG: GAF domain-containing protein [Anaerolineaceae bacterium]|nr:GAF domain-containing protein [Anaerolineaceae bacterium]